MTNSTDSDLPPYENILGAMWMFAGALMFSVVWLCVKIVGRDLPAPEISFMRAIIGLIFLMPFFWRRGWGVFKTQRPGLHIMRVFFTTIYTISSYYGMSHLPMAMATSLTFTRPMFMVILGMTILGENVHWRRILATVLGFVGVVVMLGPSHVDFNLAAISPLIGAAASAASLSVIRKQAVADGTLTMMAWFATGSTVLAAIPAFIDWHTPHGIQWAYLVGVGIASSLGQYALVKALSYAEATVVNPVDYSQIIIAAAIGYFMFNEVLDMWTGIGAIIIIISTLYILFRSARVTGKAPVIEPEVPGPPRP